MTRNAVKVHEPEPQAPPAPLLDPLLVRMPGAMALTSLSESTINRLVAARSIWGVRKIGRVLAFDCKQLEAWVAAGCPRSAGPGSRNGGAK
jgi:predicted DNA-binding transcriptional regulator AlpA